MQFLIFTAYQYHIRIEQVFFKTTYQLINMAIFKINIIFHQCNDSQHDENIYWEEMYHLCEVLSTLSDFS